MKKERTVNIKTQVVSSIRKIWRTFPLKTKCLELACVDAKEKRHKRRYKCASCEKTFLLQEVEVNHKYYGSDNESLEEFITRIFCGIISYKGNEFKDKNKNIYTAEALAKKHLECLCKECHAIKTKENRKLRSKK